MTTAARKRSKYDRASKPASKAVRDVVYYAEYFRATPRGRLDAHSARSVAALDVVKEAS
jgi:hypothetical protein